MAKGRIFSGMRPTGRLHLGNLEGALSNWVKLQHEYDCIFGIADWHMLTTGYQKVEDLQENILGVTIDWLSVGLEPEVSTLMIQSRVPQHAELHLLLSMITPLGWLERCPTYKEWLRELDLRENASYGLLGYPVLQAADILVYKSDRVPVGEDQIPHLEITREIARRFNFIYGDTFPEPQALVTTTARIVGLDGQKKMSKSLGNAIYLADDAKTLQDKVNSMFTDPTKLRKDDPGHPEGCAVFAFREVYSPAEEVAELKKECKAGGLGCVACKKQLMQLLSERLAPIQEKQAYWAQRPDEVWDILEAGSAKSRDLAEATLEEVRSKLNLARSS